jgi:hypothetical protein
MSQGQRASLLPMQRANSRRLHQSTFTQLNAQPQQPVRPVGVGMCPSNVCLLGLT